MHGHVYSGHLNIIATFAATKYILLKPILHYVLGLRFVNVCDQKRERNAKKMREKDNRLNMLVSKMQGKTQEKLKTQVNQCTV